MPLLELTLQNQRWRLYEDSERVNAGKRADFSIGQHIELLIRRVEALEASAMSAGTAETPQSGSGRQPASAVGDSRDAQNTPGEHS